MTVFVIIGLVVFLVATLVYYFVFSDNFGQGEQQTLDTLKSNIETYVKSCLRAEAEYSLIILGYQSGYMFAPRYTTEYEGFPVAYLYNQGNDTMLSLPNTENQLNMFLDITLDDCLDNLNAFRDIVTVQTGELNVNTTIEYDRVLFNLDYPVTIMSGDTTATLDTFTESFDLRLGKVLATAKLLVSNIQTQQSLVDLGLMENFDLQVQVVPLSTDEQLYFITDQESILRQRPYVFAFAARYDENRAPVLFPVKDFSLSLGDRLHYYVEAEDFDNDTLTFTDNTPLFEIDPDTGEIDYIADEEGFLMVTVKVEDDKGLADTDTFFIEVEG